MFKDADEYLLKVHKVADIPECSDKTFTTSDIRRAFNSAATGRLRVDVVVQVVNNFRNGLEGEGHDKLYERLLNMRDKWCK